MTDDRIADLERLAYGSGTSDIEREDAVRELLELRALATDENAAADAGATTATTEPSGIDAAGAAGAAGLAVVPVASTAADPRRRTRRVIIAASAALVVGVFAGWQFGAREATQRAELAAAADSAFPGAQTQAEYLASFPVAADTLAARVFDRPATTADTPPNPWTDAVGEEQAEYRLLATRADGSPVYAARDGSDYCLLVVMPGGAGASSTCTDDGRFPPDGLHMGMGVEGEPDASVEVGWRPDGSLTMLVPPFEGWIPAE
ncbi:type II secretory pathway pseudopilin PulG [Agromyces hippuratus]|uniref:Type II secretory pathway pseudopilin PulG n=1 Tax=Agromyces hippuratus TaxID=286438 RepID=A0A852WWJ8_9MICO|nr:hypothetical protein [Agromyces hippuratus]NYG21948.1 type II secretory pathway pseudopilin PulG [Agromyces hippuratus]